MTITAKNLSECDAIIYKHGDVVSFADPCGFTVAEIEQGVKEMNETDPAHKYDWHFVGGRVLVKRISHAKYDALKVAGNPD